jgi:membrane protein YqaA with SNARE-associated domain
MSVTMKLASSLKRRSAHKWYGAYAGGLISLDYLIPVLPSTTLVIASSLMQPKKWLLLGLFMAAGSTIGGVAVSYFLQAFTDDLLNGLFAGVASSESWNSTMEFIRQYGAYGLFFMACLPFPIRTITLVTAFSGAALPNIAIAIWGGRIVSYVGLSFIVSRFPQLLMKISFLRRSPLLLEVLGSGGIEKKA